MLERDFHFVDDGRCDPLSHEDYELLHKIAVADILDDARFHVAAVPKDRLGRLEAFGLTQRIRHGILEPWRVRVTDFGLRALDGVTSHSGLESFGPVLDVFDTKNPPRGITSFETSFAPPGPLQTEILTESDLYIAWRALGWSHKEVKEMIANVRDHGDVMPRKKDGR